MLQLYGAPYHFSLCLIILCFSDFSYFYPLLTLVFFCCCCLFCFFLWKLHLIASQQWEMAYVIIRNTLPAMKSVAFFWPCKVLIIYIYMCIPYLHSWCCWALGLRTHTPREWTLAQRYATAVLIIKLPCWSVCARKHMLRILAGNHLGYIYAEILTTSPFACLLLMVSEWLSSSTCDWFIISIV